MNNPQLYSLKAWVEGLTMIEGTIEFDVACTTQRTFNYLSLPERQPEWIPDVLSTEPEYGNQPNRYRQTIAMGDGISDGFVLMNHCRKQEFVSYEGGSGPVHFWSEFNLTPTERGTHIRHIYRIEFRGLFKLMQPWLKRQAAVNSQAAISNLVKQLNS